MPDRVDIGDWCTLFHGDCRKIMVQSPHCLSLASVVLVTDPPYGIVDSFGTNTGKGTRTLEFAWDKRGAVTVEVVEAFRIAFGMVASFHTFCSPEQYGLIADSARIEGFTPKPWAWVKDCPPPAGHGNWWPSGFELAMYGYRPGSWFGDTNAKRANVYRSDTYRHGIRAAEKTEHPTQKWLPMIQHIVASIVPPDGTALDPFMGSGTTAVAAWTKGRKFIGIERDRSYFEMAVERIKRQTGDGPLFEQSD